MGDYKNRNTYYFVVGIQRLVRIQVLVGYIELNGLRIYYSSGGCTIPIISQKK